MRTKEYLVTGVDADTNAFVTATATTVNVALTLEAAAAAISPARLLSFTTSGDMTAVTLTIVGVDRNGNRITERVVLPSTATVVSVQAYASIISITPNATDSDTVEVGFPAGAITPWVICGLRTGYSILSTAKVSVLITAGAADGEVDVTYDYPGGYVNGVIRNDTPAVPPRVDQVITVTPGTPVDAQGIMCRFRLTSAAGTSASVRFARPG